MAAELRTESLAANMKKTQYATHHIAGLLLRGGLKPGDKLPALRCIARELNISIFAVKKAMDHLVEEGVVSAMHGSGCVMRFGVKERLLSIVAAVEKESAEDLERRLSAKGKQRLPLIALSISERSPGFFGPFLPGFSNAITLGGHSCLLSLNNGAGDLESKEIQRLLDSGSINGFLIEPVVKISSPLYLADMKRKMIPAVFFGDVDFADTDEYDSVGCDNEAGVAGLVAHLAELGHKSIFYHSLPSPLNIANKLRYASYVNAMTRRGLRPCAPLSLSGRTIEEKAAQLEEALRKMPDRPTAAICFNDFLAASLMAVLRLLGVSTPGGMSVCGFDDREMAAPDAPSLTTMRYPFEKVAERAARILLAKINASVPFASYEHALLKPELIVRGSSTRLS